MGVRAAKSRGVPTSLSGEEQGSTATRLSPWTRARTTTILPAMYLRGIARRAESPGLSPRKAQVWRALWAMRRFSACMGFGAPVDPEVCTGTVAEGDCQSARKRERSPRMPSLRKWEAMKAESRPPLSSDPFSVRVSCLRRVRFSSSREGMSFIFIAPFHFRYLSRPSQLLRSGSGASGSKCRASPRMESG